MAVRFKPLRELVIVISGASSGIGRATARNGDAFKQIEREIVGRGGQTLAVVSDVTSGPTSSG